MRLRLTVQRNGLPAASVLWNVSETNSTQAYTITRLLEDVNHVIPLEAEHWGLEHYVVEVAGFECLHFSPVIQALKDDDHVSIRPLMTAEVRARTLTGRHQISDDGRHLVDGVPFGRPYLRHPNRPAVRIPPRKRRRLDGAEEDTDEVGLITANGETSPVQERPARLINGDTSAGSEKRLRARTASKTVQFKDSVNLAEDEDSDDEDDDYDFAPEMAQTMDIHADSDTDDSDSESDSGTSSSESESVGTSSDSDSDSDSDSSSDSPSDSGSDASLPPEVRSSKDASHATRKKAGSPQEHIIPGQGKTGTRSRNVRRTKTNRLRHLKAAGKLPPDSDLKALDEYEAGLTQPDHEPSKSFSTYTGKRKRTDGDEETRASEDGTDLEQRKRDLMARFGEDVPSTMVQGEATPQEPDAALKSTASEETVEEEQTSKMGTPKKRLRPDTSAISRILARQAMPSKRQTKTKPLVQIPEPDGASDPDFWKSRINLSAFECWEETFELSTPPFPFQQHWDSASKLMREKDNKRKKKRTKPKREQTPVEQEEEEKIFLDYDDTGATEAPEVEINAAIEDQLRQDLETAAQADLPPLPEDMSTLSALTSGDIKEGAIIVCKFFDVNPVTITPEISDYKTAIVDREGDSGNGAGTIRLKFAQRDLPKREKKYDRKGNRIYDAADQFYMEYEDEDEGLWEGQFGELLEPKLLKAA